MRFAQVSPRVAALHVLRWRYGLSGDRPDGAAASGIRLTDFQEAAVAQARSILERRGCVLVADSVGLGKTYIALSIIRQETAGGARALLVIPAAIRPTWRRLLRQLALQPAVTIASHAQLSRGSFESREYELVVVDEAHAFRNPATRRYRALSGLCRGARLLLVTATPINNSLSDLYFQLRLGLRDDALRDLGIGSLSALLCSKLPELDTSERLERLRAELVVRRTRAFVRAHYTGAAHEDFHFPERAAPLPVLYQPLLPAALLRSIVEQLQFAAYRLSEFGVSPARSPAGIQHLIALLLLKRMESSQHAILLSLDRHIRFHERFLHALREQRLLVPRTYRELYESAEGSEQLVFEEITLQPIVGHARLQQLCDVVQNDLLLLRCWRDRLRIAEDSKLRALIELLRARAPHAKTLVFSEFRDTAAYIWRALRSRFAVALIDGSGAWLGDTRATRTVVVRRFAPRANEAPAPHAREAVQVLVATDVLAEGMNLQDADAVVSYDLPWNPVRLIQRAGRVDRIGSPHPLVRIYNFLPDREFDILLGLARRLRQKLAAVRAGVGVEAAVLEPDEPIGRLYQDLAAGAPDTLDRAEAALAGSDGFPALLYRAYQRHSEREQPIPRAGAAAHLDAGPEFSTADSDPVIAGYGSRRLLLAYSSNRGHVRDLVYDPAASTVTEEAGESARILLAALESSVAIKHVAPIDSADAAARRFLAASEVENRAAALDRRSREAELARLVRQRVMAAVDARELAAAEQVLLGLISTEKPLEWRLIGAIWSD